MSIYGENLKLSIFGQSHSEAIGMTLEGIPAGESLDYEKLNAFMARRMPGQSEYTTSRREADTPELICGVVDGVFCGTPVTAIIKNTDVKRSDYTEYKNIPRPGTADYTAEVKFGGHQDYSGGGNFSGRMTAPLCVAGGICIQLLEKLGVVVKAGIVSIGGVRGTDAEMMAEIAKRRDEGDSVGGVIECTVSGLPAGIGGALFDGMESRISSIVFGIPAVKGIEFGAGFASANMCGSMNNDAFYFDGGEIKTKTNNCGGLLGGITNGMPLIFRAAIKPTPSIAKRQESVDLRSGENVTLEINGRHDPCIVPRAVPCIEAAAAIAVYDAYLGRKKEL